MSTLTYLSKIMLSRVTISTFFSSEVYTLITTLVFIFYFST